jgi:hypothetical protein
VRLDAAHRSATIAGAATGPMGVALLLRPGLIGGAGVSARTSRAIGAADLVVAIGLLAGRPRWPWAAARAAANVPTAVALARAGTPSGRLFAASLVVLTVADAATALTLRAASQ